MNEEQLVFYHLGAALAIGLLIGVERGWQERAAEEGKRVAGVRTYGLIGFLGGGLALLSEQLGSLILGLAFLALAGILTAVHVIHTERETEDIGITSLIAGLLTFVLGALAALGQVTIAAAAAVIATLLLSSKPVLHRWLGSLQIDELRAGLKLLLISVVLLPVLPDKGYGPWKVLNPFAMWWMVVLVATISFVGYFAIKIAGARRGAVYSGLFGGLASSTALTLHFARMARADSLLAPSLVTGILLACGTMYPRMVLVASILNAELFRFLLIPATVMALTTYLPAIIHSRLTTSQKADAASPLKNPLELKTALSFGLILAIVMLLGKGLQLWVGDIGVLVLAAVSGVADVDAITLSLARMSQDELTLRIASTGVVLAAATNCFVKSGISAAIGGSRIGFQVGLPLLVSAIGGLLSAWLWVW